MSEAFKTIGLLLVLFIALPALILFFVDKIRFQGKRKTNEEREAARKAWSDRLRRPQFEEVERICGGAIPKRLRVAYEQGEVILAKNVGISPSGGDSKERYYWIAEFVPLDQEGQKHTADLSEFGRGCCFAADGIGNFFWTPVSDVLQDDAPVYFACPDPYGNEKVADNLSEFFTWLEAKMQQPNP